MKKYEDSKTSEKKKEILLELNYKNEIKINKLSIHHFPPCLVSLLFS